MAENEILLVDEDEIDLPVSNEDQVFDITALTAINIAKQPDWNETDTESLAYIKNKPTKVSDFTNDGDGESPFATEDYVAENGGKIDSISVNNIAQTIDTNKNVNIEVPTQTSQLENDGDGVSSFATEEYVEANGGKINSITVNGGSALPIDANKNVNIVIPEPDLSQYYTKTQIDTTVGGLEGEISENASDIAGLQTSKADASNVYTKTETDNIVDGLETDISSNTLAISANTTAIEGLQSSKADANSVYTKTESDNKYATKTGAVGSFELSINSSTYVVTLQAKDVNGDNLGSAQTIDLPLESVVVSGAYDSETKEVVLTLEGGSTIRFSVADLVSGLQTEITATNKIASTLVDDTNSTNKFVTEAEKTTWNSKQDALVSGTNIKTINNQSILGSGNLEISSGTQSSIDVQVDGVSIVDNDIANLATINNNYNENSNKIATAGDLPSVIWWGE